MGGTTLCDMKTYYNRDSKRGWGTEGEIITSINEQNRE